MRVSIASDSVSFAGREALWTNLGNAGEITLEICSLQDIELPAQDFMAIRLATTIRDHFAPEFLDWLVLRFPNLKHLRILPGFGQPRIQSSTRKTLDKLEVFVTSPDANTLVDFFTAHAPFLKKFELY